MLIFAIHNWIEEQNCQNNANSQKNLSEMLTRKSACCLQSLLLEIWWKSQCDDKSIVTGDVGIQQSVGLFQTFLFQVLVLHFWIMDFPLWKRHGKLRPKKFFSLSHDNKMFLQNLIFWECYTNKVIFWSKKGKWMELSPLQC